MKRTLTIILSLKLLLLLGCRKYETPVPEPDSEVLFTVTGQVDGQPLNLRADGSYRATSGTLTDSLDITYYYGEMLPDFCNGCEETFTLRWRANTEAQPDLDALVALNEPAYRYLPATDTATSYLITLSAAKYGMNGTVTWEVLGNTYSGDEVIIELDEEEGITKVPVHISATYDGGCSATLVDTVYLPGHGCDCHINAVQKGPTHMLYKGLAFGGPSFKYEWTFLDSSVSASSQEVDYHYGPLPPGGIEKAELTITTSGCSATRRQNVVIDQNTLDCTINFNYEIEEHQEPVPGAVEIDLAEVELVYTNKQGKTFYSYLASQPGWARFIVDDHEEYSDPDFQPDKRSQKITARFDCLLSDGSETIELRAGELVLPIGLEAD